jgi:hypothetical protein
MLKISCPTNKIMVVTAENQAELNQAFVRFSEYMESPEFKGKIFTLGQFRRWYAETRGAWTFDTDWTGFNLTEEAFRPFVQGLFDPLTQLEQQLVNWVKDRSDSYSLIGAQPDGDALQHEICHALWHTEPEYREQCRNLVLSLSPAFFSQMKELIIKLGYDESVVEDEIHAYCSENASWLATKHNIHVDPEFTASLQKIKGNFVKGLK